MRVSTSKLKNCREIRCPFECICRDRDTLSDRSQGCETREFIIKTAQQLTLTGYQYVPSTTISEKGMTKIQMVKLLRDETGADLKTCVDALNYSGNDIIGARSYIEHGW